MSEPRRNPFTGKIPARTDLEVLEQMDPWPTSGEEVQRRTGWTRRRSYSAQRALKNKHPGFALEVRRNAGPTPDQARKGAAITNARLTTEHRKYAGIKSGAVKSASTREMRRKLYLSYLRLQPAASLRDAAAELWTTPPTLLRAIRENEGKHE